jgi:hypothetical protein
MLLLALGGCTTYRTATYPGIEMGLGSDRPGEKRVVEVGDVVRIVLIDGTKVQGEVVPSSPALLTLKTSRNSQSSRYMPRDETIAADSPYLDLDDFEDLGLLTVQAKHVVSIEQRGIDGDKTIGLVFVCAAVVGLAIGAQELSKAGDMYGN